MRAKITRELLRDIKPTNKTIDVMDTELKGFSVRIMPSGATHYAIRYTKDGKQARYAMGMSYPVTTVSTAREAAKKLLGTNPAAEKKAKQVGKLTLFGYIDGEYGDYILARRKAAQATIDILKTSFPTFADKPLAEITGPQVEKWRTTRLKSGTKPATVNRNIAALRSLLTKAMDSGLIIDHPLKSIKKLDEIGDPIVRYLTADEEKRLRAALDHRENRDRQARSSANKWRAARKYDLLPDLTDADFVDYLKPAVLLSLNTGIRQGELLSLRWTDINLTTGMLTV
ncbi:MAG: integrase family protein, partial [Herbaspirillum sp.]